MQDETKPFIDVDELREMPIILHGLDRADVPYRLFYDETNNIRRLRLKSSGLNVPDVKCFVLGGLGCRDLNRTVDLAPLRQAARIQSNAEELYFELFAKGDFLTVLGSRKLEVFLDWVVDGDFLVHQISLDPFYWSTVDIVDSIIANQEDIRLHHMAPVLKSDLYQILRSDRARTTDLMARYDYPDVGPDKRLAFIDELLLILEHDAGRLGDFNYHNLRGVIQMGRRDPLAFLEDQEPKVLIEAFTSFYLERIYLLKHARHVFDTETEIASRIAAMDLRSDGVPFSNFRFVERSHDEPGVQASDVMVGLLGKFYSWIVDTDARAVAAARNLLTPTQVGNLSRLARLIDRSNDENPVLTNRILSLADLQTADRFLEG